MSDPVTTPPNNSASQPSGWERLLIFLRAKSPEDVEAARRAALEAAHAALPDAMSAKSAIDLANERRKRLIDDQMKE